MKFKDARQDGDYIYTDKTIHPTGEFIYLSAHESTGTQSHAGVELDKASARALGEHLIELSDGITQANEDFMMNEEHLKQNIIWLVEEHKKRCDDPGCAISLYFVRVLAEKAGIVFTEEEASTFR